MTWWPRWPRWSRWPRLPGWPKWPVGSRLSSLDDPDDIDDQVVICKYNVLSTCWLDNMMEASQTIDRMVYFQIELKFETKTLFQGYGQKFDYCRSSISCNQRPIATNDYYYSNISQYM